MHQLVAMAVASPLWFVMVSCATSRNYSPRYPAPSLSSCYQLISACLLTRLRIAHSLYLSATHRSYPDKGVGLVIEHPAYVPTATAVVYRNVSSTAGLAAIRKA